MSLRDDMAREAAIPATDLGDTFTWNSQDWPCVIGDHADKFHLDYGGDFTLADFVIVTVKAQFGDILPAQRDRVTIAGTEYQIAGVGTSDSDPFLEIQVANL
jgi:hypothetical protein